ncbi:hypothetical protein [Nonomuraea sp. NPDC050783]|uniref:hypothetical protein n=1 Tax=Nonomuraea sp. NPDC050783 TaxID=3154634 RepID=UPI0034660504
MIDERPPQSRPQRHRLIRAVLVVAPPAAAFTTYGLLLDHLSESWFKVDVLRYLLALLAAGVVWLGLALVRRLPSVAGLLAESPVIGPAAGSGTRAEPGPTVLALAEGAKQQVLDAVTGHLDHPALRGWGQFLGDGAPPSATGTSYGLRLVLALDLRDPRLDRAMLVRTLLALQCEAGGWASTSQRGVARPEVTAWALGAACRAGLERDERVRLTALLEDVTKKDVSGLNKTTVVTTVLSTLTEVPPSAALVAELADLLITRLGRRDERVGWGETLSERQVPSLAHTARAVVALRRAAGVLPHHARLDEVIRAGVGWLVTADDLSNGRERLRRQEGMQHETLTIDHFTAAWVAKALLICGDPDPVALRRAVAAVLAQQENGIWQWEQGPRPIWMTYQGLSVIRDYAMRRPVL